MKTAIIAITANGARIGETLRDALPDSRLFVMERHAQPGAEPFPGGLSALVGRLWPEFGGLVFVMASGIVVRSIAPLLQGKDRDPAVVVLDDAGRFAISLLCGHLGGANALAAECAAVTGAHPVVTTATDVNGLPSFDMLAKENGWLIEDLSRVKVLNALLLEGGEIAVVDEADAVRGYFSGQGRLSFYGELQDALQSRAGGWLFVTNKVLPSGHDPARTLVLRPMNLCLGIGCNRGTSAGEIDEVVAGQMARLSLSLKSVRAVATAAAKRDEDGLLQTAARIGVPVLFYESEELNGVEVPSPPSDHAFAAIGARGVAEPAALLASAGGRLLLHKVKEGNVTLAIAETR